MEKSSENNLKVVARFRPLINIELELAETQELQLKYVNETTVAVPKVMEDYEYFNFDKVFPSSATQQEIFEFVGVPIIEDVLTGYNGTVFAYGQTGSGKTYTMMGSNVSDETNSGIIPRALSLIFQSLASATNETEFTVKCSMLEIYKETLKDLLGHSGELKIKQDKRKGIYIEGLTEVYVVCEEETLEVLTTGESNRTVASTKMNSASSRSHQIFMVEILQKLPNGSEKKGKLNLVDLAGSEKISQTGVTGNKLEEAKKINLSLSALGNVIKALTDKAEHIPYRDSKLTRLLQESLGGNFKTTLIVNCSPHPRNVEDTLNTLKFAQRAKTIKNKAVVNIKKSPEAYMRIIKELQIQLADVLKELTMYKSGCSPILLTKTDEKSPVDLSLESKFSEIRIGDQKIEERLRIDELYDKLNSLKQDQEHSASRVQELEEELDREHKKMMKVEKENFELTEKYGNLLNNQLKVGQSESFYSEKNRSLHKQVEVLKYHLERITEKYTENLSKLKNGETITEWEFTDMSKFLIDKNAKLPIYTEEDSLEVVNTSEFNIDIPIHESILLKNDRYANGLCQKIEDKSKVNMELLIFELKKQFIQSGILNCELSRSYFDLLWKYKLLREKLNLRSKVIKSQKQRITVLENVATSLSNSYAKLVEIIQKLESNAHEVPVEQPVRRNMVRFVKPQNTIAPNEMIRKKKRTGTVAFTNFMPSNLRNSFNIALEPNNKYLFLESSLQNQIMFNDQLKKSNDTITVERNSYKKLLDELINENQKIYLKEKERWKQFLDEFKFSCEEELVRKQVELNKLNEILGRWMHKYMELEEIYGVKGAKILSTEYKEKIKDLVDQTQIQFRPKKLQLSESPLHCRFKSTSSTQVSNIFGDISPPSFD